MSTDSQDRKSPRLLDQVRELIRIRHYSIRTEQAYVQWIRRFILFHDKRHPLELGASEVTAFLSHLAVKRNVAASTQNRAMNAILFLYRDVLKCTLPWLDGVQLAKKPQRLPVVLRGWQYVFPSTRPLDRSAFRRRAASSCTGRFSAAWEFHR